MLCPICVAVGVELHAPLFHWKGKEPFHSFQKANQIFQSKGIFTNFSFIYLEYKRIFAKGMTEFLEVKYPSETFQLMERSFLIMVTGAEDLWQGYETFPLFCGGTKIYSPATPLSQSIDERK